MPRHVHTHEDEAFYVLDGEVSMHIGDEVIGAIAGSFLWGPRTVPHAFRIESETAKLLVISTPGGFDRFFDTGTAAAAPNLPPPAANPPDLNAIVVAAHEHGVDVIGPPPRPSERELEQRLVGCSDA